jgi:hypothetical protein
MTIPSAQPQILDFFGTLLVIELSPGQLTGDAGSATDGPADTPRLKYARAGTEKGVKGRAQFVSRGNELRPVGFARPVAAGSSS